MKLKTIKIPRFIHRDHFGEFLYSGVKILFDPKEANITPSTFDQDKNDYFIGETEINTLAHKSALRFYNAEAKDILQGKKKLSVSMIKGIKEFLGVNATELGKLIGCDKSSISRFLAKKQMIPHDKAKLLMAVLKEELHSPGVNRIILSHFGKRGPSSQIKMFDIDPLLIAEYFIRRFEELDSSITQLKLQKMIYYAQGIALGKYGVKLFNEPLLAWKHGPVIKSVYDEYGRFKKKSFALSKETRLEGY